MWANLVPDKQTLACLSDPQPSNTMLRRPLSNAPARAATIGNGEKRFAEKWASSDTPRLPGSTGGRFDPRSLDSPAADNLAGNRRLGLLVAGTFVRGQLATGARGGSGFLPGLGLSPQSPG